MIKNFQKMISVVSLFSGCGGLDSGFDDNTFDLKMAYDNDPAAIKCLTYNLKAPGKVVDVTSKDFLQDLKTLGQVDVVLGGFPCQGFSKAGPKNNDDPRNQLYLSMLNAVASLKPKLFIGENVDGIAQNFSGTFITKIKADFLEIGYKVEYRILNAVNFGVPQYRRRAIFVGTLVNSTEPFHWPKPTNYGSSRNGEFKTQWDISPNIFEWQSLSPEVTIKNALADLLNEDESFPDHKTIENIKKSDLLIVQAIKEGQKLCNVRFSETSVYTWNIPSVYGATSSKDKIILETIGKNRRKKIYGDIPNGNPLHIDIIKNLTGMELDIKDLDSLVERKYLKKIGEKYDLSGAMFCSGLYKRPLWNQPSPTVLTVFYSPRYFIHPIKDRPLTIRECARLQSFPDTFKFLESGVNIKDAYRLIGNAVPPLLAKNIALSVKEYIYNIRNIHETIPTDVIFQ